MKQSEFDGGYSDGRYTLKPAELADQCESGTDPDCALDAQIHLFVIDVSDPPPAVIGIPKYTADPAEAIILYYRRPQVVPHSARAICAHAMRQWAIIRA